ncbi:MAG: hypothetical protein HC848_01640 [Limnobacter sp.]|nr:hypothetical protein [Limnobacter sp.]
MKTYDLILVVGYFRTATSLLSVIKGLGRTLRIAVLSVEADSAMHSKTGEAHQVFLHLCQKLGAELLHLGEPAQATLLVVHQFPYTNELARAILHKVTAQKRVGLMTLAMAGREVHDHFLQQFELRKVYVPSQRFLSFLLDKRHAQTRYSNVQIQEVGLPFAKYPLFPEFSADWLIAAPTLFSFHSEQGKQQFLNSVLELLEKIPPQDVVVYKSHNGNSLDYFVPRAHYHLANWLEHVPGATKLVWLAQRLTHALPWRWPHLQIQRLQTCMLHRAVLRRAMPMPAVTQYAGISLEAFLPGVRKGVIGGLSNTIGEPCTSTCLTTIA